MPIPIPWMQVVDGVMGLADVVMSRRARKRQAAAPADPQAMEPGMMETGALTARLAGVVAVAVKETLDRDSRRLDFEREELEASRERAERALRLELQRQAGDREIGRLRLMAAVAAASWLVALVLAVRFAGGGIGSKLVLGAGAASLVGALGCVFAGFSEVNRSLARPDTGRQPAPGPGPAVALAAWLIVAGLGFVSVAVFIA